MMEQFCKKIPKLELHAHLNGSVDDKTLLELYKKKGLIEKYNHLSSIIRNGESRTLSKCFDLFNFVYMVTDNTEAIDKITCDIISDFYNDGVIYLELRTTPRAVEGEMTKDDYICTVINAIEKMSTTLPNIKVKLIISLSRKENESEAKESIDLAIKYYEKYPNIVCGVDVSSDPSKGTWFKNLLSEARDNGLKIAVHAAEIPNIEETKEILDFKPDRIGHGSCIHQSCRGTKKLWNMLLESKIPVECCLTSNVKTKTIVDYSDHHLKYLLEANHPVAICTDDKGIFSTTLSKELQLAAEYFSLGFNSVWELTYNTVNYSFCSEEEKAQLRQKLIDWNAKCMKNMKHSKNSNNI